MPLKIVRSPVQEKAVGVPERFLPGIKFETWLTVLGPIGTLDEIPSPWRVPLLKQGVIVRLSPANPKLVHCTVSAIRPLSFDEGSYAGAAVFIKRVA